MALFLFLYFKKCYCVQSTALIAELGRRLYRNNVDLNLVNKKSLYGSFFVLELCKNVATYTALIAELGLRRLYRNNVDFNLV